MNSVEKYLIQILSDHLNNRKTEEVPDIDWEVMYNYAHKHQIEGIIYHQCRNFISNEYEPIFHKANDIALYYYLNRRKFLSEITEELNNTGIEYFIVKGDAVADYYPVPPLRTMGDTDMVIKPDRREKVHEIMLSMKFENCSKIENREWIYKKRNLEFEIHNSLIYNEEINEDIHEKYFSNPWEHCSDNKLDCDYHFLYLILHLRKHFLNSGVGFRQFTDIATQMKYNENLNWEKIETELKKIKLYDFTKVCFGFIERWFGITCPVKGEIIDDDFFEKSTEKIFENVIFGFDNPENRVGAIVNVSRKVNNVYLSMIVTVFKYLFPSYENIVSVKRYSFIKNKPYLLPVAWIYRLFTGLFRGKTDKGMDKMKNTFVDKDTINSRTEMLDKWKL